ncbi:MAG: hypothetical protein ACKVP7_01880 [Hyphomicrobiaceae bacterium]
MADPAVATLAFGEGAATVTFGNRDHADRRSPSDAEVGVTQLRRGIFQPTDKLIALPKRTAYW